MLRFYRVRMTSSEARGTEVAALDSDGRTQHTFDRYDDVRAVLADPHLVPPPAEPGPVGGLAWLRATVARFSTGEAHARRRAQVQADLDRLDLGELRRAAAYYPDDEPSLVVVRVLAEALGLPQPAVVARAVTVVAGEYFGDDADDPDADDAVARLLSLLLPTGCVDDASREAAANRIGLLVQACDATAGLIARARQVGGDLSTGQRVQALLVETLRHDPPVRVMRRIAAADTRVAGVEIAAGAMVTCDVAAANRDPSVFTDPHTFDPDRCGAPSLTFGSAPRVCPGREQAMAVAVGVLSRSAAGPAPLVGGAPWAFRRGRTDG